MQYAVKRGYGREDRIPELLGRHICDATSPVSLRLRLKKRCLLSFPSMPWNASWIGVESTDRCIGGMMHMCAHVGTGSRRIRGWGIISFASSPELGSSAMR